MGNNHTREEYMLKEIDIIQDIIKRMANNSFMIKGWTLTMVVITLLLKGGNTIQIGIAIIPLIGFWYLDAYYLWQERLYRRLYNWVINHRLTTDEHLFDMNATGRFKREEQSIGRIMFSKTLLCYYGIILIMIITYATILYIG